MTTQENGSLGLTKKSILERLDTLIELNSKIYEATLVDKIAVVTEDVTASVTAVDIKTGLTDEQVVWVKNKISQVETLVNQAQAAFATVNQRLTALETKASQAVTKFTSLDTKIAAIEARLTAHKI